HKSVFRFFDSLGCYHPADQRRMRTSTSEQRKNRSFLSTFLFALLIIYQHIKTISYRILGKVQLFQVTWSVCLQADQSRSKNTKTLFDPAKAGHSRQNPFHLFNLLGVNTLLGQGFNPCPNRAEALRLGAKP
ncbi:MAG: hypothetical protein ACE5K2_05385, partial [Candidatus Zixiibacteriota bacterium]